MEKPQDFEIEGKEEKVYRLKKALYELKQAPRAWCNNIDNHFMEKSFEKRNNELNLECLLAIQLIHL